MKAFEVTFEFFTDATVITPEDVKHDVAQALYNGLMRGEAAQDISVVPKQDTAVQR